LVHNSRRPDHLRCRRARRARDRLALDRHENVVANVVLAVVAYPAARCNHRDAHVRAGVNHREEARIADESARIDPRFVASPPLT